MILIALTKWNNKDAFIFCKRQMIIFFCVTAGALENWIPLGSNLAAACIEAPRGRHTWVLVGLQTQW